MCHVEAMKLCTSRQNQLYGNSAIRTHFEEGLSVLPTFYRFNQPVNVERGSTLSDEVIVLENIQNV
jgi:hypothetical protein